MLPLGFLREELSVNSRSRDRFYSLWTIAIYLSVFLALFALFFVSCQKAPETAEEPSIDETLSETEPEADAPVETPFQPTTILAQTDDQGTVYLDKCIFLGDLNTYMLAETETLPQRQVWSTSSGTLNLSDAGTATIVYTGADGSTQDLSIANAAATHQPQYLVINIGLNGLSSMTEDSFKQAYTDLVTAIQTASPNTKIMCQSILPVIDTMSSEVQNSRIERANRWILDVAEATDTRYLNAAELLMDDTENLRSEYAGSDGVRLSQPGCMAVLYYVRTHGYQ